MTISNELKGLKIPTAKSRSGPLWEGPESSGPQGGITFSLLSRWLVCKERFRIHAIEGWGLPDTFRHRIEYGSMWHVCEESFAGGKNWLAALTEYAKKLTNRYPAQQEQVSQWYKVCMVQFPIYTDYWKKHPDIITRTPLLQEKAFRVPYKLPSGRTVYLRGKWDSVDVAGSGPALGVWLQENKSKGEIDEQQLQRQLLFDLQTMLYITAIITGRNKSPLVEVWPKGTRFVGVRYNVCRRPLAGGRHTIRQNKNETEEAFYARLGGLIRGEPEYFFMRWNVQINSEDIKIFQRTCLDPILEQLCQWYKVVALNEMPWQLPEWAINWRTPYGVYNPLLEGIVGELDNALDSGSRIGLRQLETLFPELEE